MARAPFPDSTMLNFRAEECRTLAAGFRDPDNRARMIQVALDYEDMAVQAEKRERADYSLLEGAMSEATPGIGLR